MRVAVFRFAYWGASQTPGGGGYRWGPLCQARDFGGTVSASLLTHPRPWRTPFWARTSQILEIGRGRLRVLATKQQKKLSKGHGDKISIQGNETTLWVEALKFLGQPILPEYASSNIKEIIPEAKKNGRSTTYPNLLQLKLSRIFIHNNTSCYRHI